MDVPDTEVLQKCPMFEGLSKDELRPLFRICETRHISKGTVLFREGDRSRYIVVVMKGRLGVRKHIIDKKDDNIPLCPVFAELGIGEIVGEFSFFDDSPRSAEVYAMTDAIALVLEPEAFERSTGEFPELSRRVTVNMLKMLIRRMRQTSEQLSIALEWGWEAYGYIK